VERSETRDRLGARKSCIRDHQRHSALTALKKALRSKRATGFRVGAISEDDKYGDDGA
jgi:hypothetical protein